MNKSFSICNKNLNIIQNDQYDVSCAFTYLPDWSLVSVLGCDSMKYLQSQITINVLSLKEYQHIVCAHCNAHGKVLSVLRLFHYQNGYAYIQRKSVCARQIDELRKYSIFSNIQITKLENYFLLGVTGLNAKQILSLYFQYVPNEMTSVIYINNNILLWIKYPIERFLLIIHEKDINDIKNFLSNQCVKNMNNAWLLLDMKSRFPIIEKEIIGKFIPQEINLDSFNGIDYKKGCYNGQEVISRIHFKNINSRNLYYLLGISGLLPTIFCRIEMYHGMIWKYVGRVIFILPINKNIIGIQCILSKKIDLNGIFRVEIDKNSRFIIR